MLLNIENGKWGLTICFSLIKTECGDWDCKSQHNKKNSNKWAGIVIITLFKFRMYLTL